MQINGTNSDDNDSTDTDPHTSRSPPTIGVHQDTETLESKHKLQDEQQQQQDLSDHSSVHSHPSPGLHLPEQVEPMQLTTSTPTSILKQQCPPSPVMSLNTTVSDIDEGPLLTESLVPFNLTAPSPMPPYLNVHYICESASRLLFLSVHWARNIPAFQCLRWVPVLGKILVKMCIFASIHIAEFFCCSAAQYFGNE